MDSLEYFKTMKPLAPGSEPEIRSVPVSLITVPAGAVNRVMIEQLVAQFRANGPSNEFLPEVEWDGANFLLRRGKSRILAARLAGLDSIPCMVKVPPLK